MRPSQFCLGGVEAFDDFDELIAHASIPILKELLDFVDELIGDGRVDSLA